MQSISAVHVHVSAFNSSHRAFPRCLLNAFYSLTSLEYLYFNVIEHHKHNALCYIYKLLKVLTAVHLQLPDSVAVLRYSLFEALDGGCFATKLIIQLVCHDEM